MNPITIGGLPVYEAPRGERVNFFYSHTGAAKYGSGMFLMFRDDYKKVAEKAGTSAIVELKMDSSSGDGLKIDVIVRGAEPFSIEAGTLKDSGEQPGDVVRVLVVDQRYNKLNSTTKHYNEISQPFSWDDDEDRPNYYSQTLNSGDPWTWEEIVTNLESCPAMPSYPSWVPNDLGWDQVPLGLVIDDFMSRLYWVVGWNATDNLWTCNTPGEMNADNTILFNQASKEDYYSSGAGERNLNSYPGIFRVSFRAFNSDDPWNPYIQPSTYARSYTKDITVGTGTKQQPLACGQIMGIWQAGGWKNDAEMDTVAADIAPRAYKAMTVPPEEWAFSGIWPFSPDGAIRGILWISDSIGARTIIRLNNDRDFTALPTDDPLVVNQTQTNQLVVGLGASNVGFDAGAGVRQIWADSGGVRLANLSKSSGDNAVTPTDDATYKYTGTDYLTGAKVFTDISPDGKWRPQGILHGPADLGYYITKDGTTNLLNTNEKQNLVACS